MDYTVLGKLHHQGIFSGEACYHIELTMRHVSDRLNTSLIITTLPSKHHLLLYIYDV